MGTTRTKLYNCPTCGHLMLRCIECDQPMLPKGQRRKHLDDYRHARSCSLASSAEHKATEALWHAWERGG